MPEGADVADVAQHVVLDEVVGVVVEDRVMPLVADGQKSILLLGHANHFFTLRDIVGHQLFAQNVLARLESFAGRGAVPLHNLMEDEATAEISRAQVWQWIYHKAKLDDGREVTAALVKELLDDEMAKARAKIDPHSADAERLDLIAFPRRTGARKWGHPHHAGNRGLVR